MTYKSVTASPHMAIYRTRPTLCPTIAAAIAEGLVRRVLKPNPNNEKLEVPYKMVQDLARSSDTTKYVLCAEALAGTAELEIGLEQYALTFARLVNVYISITIRAADAVHKKDAELSTRTFVDGDRVQTILTSVSEAIRTAVLVASLDTRFLRMDTQATATTFESILSATGRLFTLYGMPDCLLRKELCHALAFATITCVCHEIWSAPQFK